ncbi:MAG: hypothetical protein FWF51_09020 [Chitinivibrionia bacterium]|nr:hypothetical protein [Chitinivibrionia bacterium]
MEDKENKVLRIYIENNDKKETVLEKFSNLSFDVGKILLAGAVASDVFSKREILSYIGFSGAAVFLFVGSVLFVVFKVREKGGK